MLGQGSLFITISLAVAAAAHQLEVRQADISQRQCNGIVGEYLGKAFCCPGVVYDVDSNSKSGSGYCCVGAIFNLPVGQFSDCYPNCGPRAKSALPSQSGIGNLSPISSTQSCVTTIRLTDSDYASKANAYGAGITGPLSTDGPGAITSTAGGVFQPNPTPSLTRAGTESTRQTTVLSGTRTDSSRTTTTGTTTGASSTSSSAPGSSSSASGVTASSGTSSGSGARITSGPMAGAFMVAGGVILAAL